MAVGFSKNSTTNSLQDLAEFWDGRGLFGIHPHWTIQPTQGTFSEVNYTLNAVSCSPTTDRLGVPTDCLAVGSYVSPFSSTPDSYYTWSEHWDGASWSAVLHRRPQQQLQRPSRVVMPSRRLHRRRRRQRQQRHGLSPSRSLERDHLDAAVPRVPDRRSRQRPGPRVMQFNGDLHDSGWATPPYGNNPYQNVPMAESWDGTYWTLGSPLSPISGTQSVLLGVSCPAVAVCTAVGRSGLVDPCQHGRPGVPARRALFVTGLSPEPMGVIEHRFPLSAGPSLWGPFTWARRSSSEP